MAPFKDPAFVLVYGVSKIGKTTDTLYSFPNAFFIAPPGALKPSVNVVGFEIPEKNTFDARRVSEATAMLPKAKAAGHDVCVVDDFSLECEQTFYELEKKFSGWKIFAELQDEVLAFRDTARRCGMHVVMNCHEQPASLKNGFALRGGPRLPGKLPESLPAGCDLVLRATAMGAGFGGNGKLGWAGCYRCNPNDVGYVSGDRHGVTPDMAPMNLAEILRAAGYVIRRAPGLEWMDKAVDMLTPEMLKRDPALDKAFVQEALKWLASQGVQRELHARWVIRDVVDRSYIARARAASTFAMFA